MGERLDYTDKSVWKKAENTPRIARDFGFVDDASFNQAVKLFYEEVVGTALITQVLASVAVRYFNNFKPPLNRT
jgi:hypothetical protein